jgi:hypothetical protein
MFSFPDPRALASLDKIPIELVLSERSLLVVFSVISHHPYFLDHPPLEIP